MGFIKRGLQPIIRRLPIHKVTPQIVELKQESLLQGRTALVTGGTSGIGNEIARSFLKAGATVLITGRNQERIDKVVAEMKKDIPNAPIYGLAMNMIEVGGIKEKMSQVLQILPSHQIDILVNNAGVSGDSFATTTEEQYDNTMDTNLKGVYFLSQYIAHYYIDNKIKGNILNIASSSSLRPANSAYSISKWGIRGLTEGLARVLAPYGITVNGIAPGQTVTPMMQGATTDNIYHPTNLIGRYILPVEIANMAVILVSEAGRSIVGDIVYMTGGSGNVTNEDLPYEF